jgi:hypothetical protein|tara:strand:+ start:141 stop:404 length:264 start_codon:yes stop_codon:yes gene_type:complete
MVKQEDVDFLVDLAMECEISDPIDWGMLHITEKQAYQMMASQILEQFSGVNKQDMVTVILATATKLLVENFVLNLQLKGAENVLKGI